MTTFSYTTGNPANLTGGASASMTDIQGPFTDLRTFLNGGNIDQTNLANSGVTVSKLAAVPGCYLYATTGVQSWGAGTEAVVAFQNEGFDTDGMHSGSSSRATASTAGVYVATGRLDLNTTTGGLVMVQLLVNGARVAATHIPSGGQFASVAYTRKLSVADYVELDVRNDSGGSILLNQAELIVVRISA